VKNLDRSVLEAKIRALTRSLERIQGYCEVPNTVDIRDKVYNEAKRVLTNLKKDLKNG